MAPLWAELKFLTGCPKVLVFHKSNQSETLQGFKSNESLCLRGSITVL